MNESTNQANLNLSMDEIFALSIDTLKLSNHTRAALKAAHIITVGDIVSTETEQTLLRVRNIGRTHRFEIQVALSGYNLNLDGTPRIEDVHVQDDKPNAQNNDCEDENRTEDSISQSIEPSSHSLAITRLVSPSERAQLKTVAFVDFENWFFSLRANHDYRKPNLDMWFSDLKERGRLMEVTFFGDFSGKGGLKDEVATIRQFTNRIIETKNPSEHAQKDFTDFIMLDAIYQKIIASPEIEQVVIFTGDGHFASVLSYLRNFCNKVVGVYGVKDSISSQLANIADWCIQVPFIEEINLDCRNEILTSLQYAIDHSKKPTFKSTVRIVAERSNLPDDAVQAELKKMISEGIIYSLSERSHFNYNTFLNILYIDWEKLNTPTQASSP